MSRTAKTDRHPGKVLARRKLDEVTRYAAAHYGFKTALVREMTRISRPRMVWILQDIERMFCANRERRVEPAYGTGLLLMQAYENIKARNGNGITKGSVRLLCKQCGAGWGHCKHSKPK